MGVYWVGLSDFTTLIEKDIITFTDKKGRKMCCESDQFLKYIIYNHYHKLKKFAHAVD